MSEEQAEYGTTEIIKYNTTRLELAIVPTWEQAEQITGTLDRIGRNVNWWIGDWLNYLADLFPEQWTQLLPDIGWDNKTLMNWKFVAENVRPNARYENLTWSHHEAVAGQPPERQDELLAMAMEGGWTVSRLREEIRGPKKEKLPKMYHVRCPHCEAEFDWSDE